LPPSSPVAVVLLPGQTTPALVHFSHAMILAQRTLALRQARQAGVVDLVRWAVASASLSSLSSVAAVPAAVVDLVVVAFFPLNLVTRPVATPPPAAVPFLLEVPVMVVVVEVVAALVRSMGSALDTPESFLGLVGDMVVEVGRF